MLLVDLILDLYECHFLLLCFKKNLYIIVDITISNTNIKYDNTHVKIEKIVSLTLISIPLL